MDTMKDTKMQPAKDAVIEELRKVIADCYWPTSPVTINEILDRLEAAEKERDKLKELNIALCTKSNSQVIHNARLAEENDALRAKIEQMEQQVPICRAEDLKHAESLLPTLGLKPENPLYALPGAQNAPVEQDESVRKAWSRFSNELHRSPDAPYPGMSEAFEQHFSQSFTDRDWRAESGTWAAAWKAAKRHGAQTQPAPSVPDGWLRAIDEALVTAHIGVANAHDTYEQAKAKLDNLIGFHVDVATDPAVNGGWKLVPIEPTEDMLRAMTDPFIAINGETRIAFEIAYTAMLSAAPEAKP